MTLTRLHRILLGALAVQLVLIVVVRARGGGDTPIGERALVTLDPAAVTSVKVYADGDDKPKVELAKRDKDWVLASHWDYPADAAKVTEVLTPIGKMMVNEPVATSTTRHKQMRVGDKDFERKLVITAGGKDTVVYLGASAGLKRTAVRLGGDDDVYAATGVTTYSINAQPRDWVKGYYYDIPKDQIAKVTIQRGASTIELERAQVPVEPPASGSGSAAGSGSGSGSAVVPPPPAMTESWKVTIDKAPLVVTAPEKLDTMLIEDILADIASLPKIPADPKRDASQPTATITVQRKAGAADTLVVVADGESFWVKQQGTALATLVPKMELDKLVSVSREKLAKKPDPQAPPPEDPPTPGMPNLPPGFQLPPQ